MHQVDFGSINSGELSWHVSSGHPFSYLQGTSWHLWVSFWSSLGDLGCPSGGLWAPLGESKLSPSEFKSIPGVSLVPLGGLGSSGGLLGNLGGVPGRSRRRLGGVLDRLGGLWELVGPRGGPNVSQKCTQRGCGRFLPALRCSPSFVD